MIDKSEPIKPGVPIARAQKIGASVAFSGEVDTFDDAYGVEVSSSEDSGEDVALAELRRLFPDATVLEVAECNLIHLKGDGVPCDGPRVEDVRNSSHGTKTPSWSLSVPSRRAKRPGAFQGALPRR